MRTNRVVRRYRSEEPVTEWPDQPSRPLMWKMYEEVYRLRERGDHEEASQLYEQLHQALKDRWLSHSQPVAVSSSTLSSTS
jgi:hypothetical protein